MRLSFPWAHAPTLAAVPLNPPRPLPQVFVLASVQVYMTQTGTLALATLPFLSRGSVLIDLGMPTGARPTFYAAEYVYATFDHVQVCGCTHPSSLRHALSQHGATAACAFAFLLTRQEHETAEPVRWSGHRQAGHLCRDEPYSCVLTTVASVCEQRGHTCSHEPRT